VALSILAIVQYLIAASGLVSTGCSMTVGGGANTVV
jgi:hypothetical protein